jgi:tetratricopeptide (TPR) repeat protein
MSRERSRTIRGNGRSWQGRVWARIALDRLRRSGWPRRSDSNIVVPHGGNMSDGSREPVVSLERPVRTRRSWLRRLLRLAIVCVGVAIVAEISDIGLLDRGRECTAAVHGQRRDAVAVCERAYQDDQDPVIGVLLAKAYFGAGDRAAAARLARQLLNTPQRSDALQMLGRVARADGSDDDAKTALQEARRLHRIEGRWEGLAGDDGLLAMIQIDRDEFAEALRLVSDCITDARLVDSPPLQRYCHLAAAKTFTQIGYWPAAEHEFDIVADLSATDFERSSVIYQRGSWQSEMGHHALASSLFQNALRLRGRPQDTQWILKTSLDLAYSLAEQNKIGEAQHYLEDATLLDADHKKEPERTWVAARIAYGQDDLTKAVSLVEKYFQLRGSDDPVDRDDRINVATLGASIELDRHDLERARFWAQRGIEQAELARGAQSVLELRSWVLGKRRAPYELLFLALARSHLVEAAVMAFDQWQGRTVQDALVKTRTPASPDYRGVADHITKLGEWLSVASRAPFAKTPDLDTLLRTMRDVDLLALIVARDEVWRLTANHGPPQLIRLGRLAEIKELVDQFRGHPLDVQEASVVAARLVPGDMFRKTNEALQVLIDGQLAGLPMAALRRDGIPLVALRPIVHLLRLPETPCVHVRHSEHATVLAYSPGDLPETQKEAEQVGLLLHAIASTGAAATKAVLLSASHDAVLHVATHGKVDMDGAVLELADGDVSALEISARGVAPSLAVLSACDAAVSNGPELAGSLVAGFLGAGSQHVVATLSGISDAGAPEITTRFYRAGGPADPVHALAKVQSELARTSNVDWPRFVVFGPDVCPEGASGSR